MYLIKFKEARSKSADFDGRVRYVVINDTIMKCFDSGKLERFTEASFGQHTVNEKSLSSFQDHVNKVDDCSF